MSPHKPIMSLLDNLHVESAELLATPREIHAELPQTSRTMQTVLKGRETVERILDHEDPRILAIVGPCSIHNLEAAEEYALKLKALADDIADEIVVVMRVYFEKPRSVLGWKGLINDPYMNDTFRIEEGLRMARRFLLRIAEIGLPAGTELLDTLVPQYIADLVSWAAIGARTAEAQTHRELASGSSMPVGFKNGTDGCIDTALNGMQSALGPHHFLGVTPDGLPAVFNTTGNPHPHLVLRGGKTPNYDEATIRDSVERLKAKKLPLAIIVDCSHANSAKKPERQALVLDDILGQLERGNRAIRGFMLESNLDAGAQPIPHDLSTLSPRISVTDACIGWDATDHLLRTAHARMKSKK
jgi:3-deoxy-7-phosphoheptulonate synthase